MTLQKTIHNCVTGETVTRDFTADEMAEHEKIEADAAAQAKKVKTAAAAKQLARQAVLDKLGLTADEVTALLS